EAGVVRVGVDGVPGMEHRGEGSAGSAAGRCARRLPVTCDAACAANGAARRGRGGRAVAPREARRGTWGVESSTPPWHRPCDAPPAMNEGTSRRGLLLGGGGLALGGCAASGRRALVTPESIAAS